MTKRKIVGLFLLAAKIFVSIALLWSIGASLALDDVFVNLGEIKPVYFIAAVAAIGVQFLVAAHRQSILLALWGSSIGPRRSVETILVGAFFSNSVITFIGGDAMRVWRLVRFGLGFRNVVSAIITDRVIGFAAIVVLVTILLPYTLTTVDESVARWSVRVLAFGGLVGIVVYLGLGLFPKRFSHLLYLGALYEFATASRKILTVPGVGVYSLMMGVAMHVLNLVGVYFLCTGLNLNLGFLDALILVPPVLFISMLPISVAGWGVREGAMVVALGFALVPAEGAVTASIAFGLIHLSISLLGAPIWFFGRATEGQIHDNGRPAA